MREVTMYSTVPDCVKLVVANKLDAESERQVTRAEGVAFARAHGCLFMEVSAKSRLGVQEAFAELVQRVRLTCACAPGARSYKQCQLTVRPLNRQIAESPVLLAASTASGGRVQLAQSGGVVSSCSSAC